MTKDLFRFAYICFINSSKFLVVAFSNFFCVYLNSKLICFQRNFSLEFDIKWWEGNIVQAAFIADHYSVGMAFGVYHHVQQFSSFIMTTKIIVGEVPNSHKCKGLPGKMLGMSVWKTYTFNFVTGLIPTSISFRLVIINIRSYLRILSPRPTLLFDFVRGLGLWHFTSLSTIVQ